MTDFEAVTEIVSRTGVTYEEAKNAYEQSGKNALDAVIILERKGNLPVPKTEKFRYRKPRSGRFGRFVSWICRAFGSAVSYLCRNNLRVWGAREYFTIPLILPIIALPLFEILFPAMVVSLFFGVHYTLTGPDISRGMTLGIDRPAGYGAYGFSSAAEDNGFFKK